LATDYAIAADTSNSDLFASVFVPEGHLIVRRTSQPDATTTDLSGRENLREVPVMLERRFIRTYHFLGQARYEIHGSEANGTVYCQASHLLADDQDEISYVMNIRYEDRYRRSQEEGWRIAERTGWIDWTERRPASSSS
jgi:hypothetical protein